MIWIEFLQCKFNLIFKFSQEKKKFTGHKMMNGRFDNLRDSGKFLKIIQKIVKHFESLKILFPSLLIIIQYFD